MTLEKLNLQITTPEDDNNTDPEFIRLHDALMALKKPLLDAIANKDLPKAEELHAKALEAKAKLEAYKESLKKSEKGKFTYERYLSDLHPFMIETYKKWSYTEEQLKVVESVTSNPDNIHIDKNIPFEKLIEINNVDFRRNANRGQTGEIFLSSESPDFEKAKVFIPSIPDNVKAQGAAKVMDYVIKTYENRYIIPDIKYFKYLLTFADQYNSETNENKRVEILRLVPEQIRDGNWYYFPKSVFVGKSGCWYCSHLSLHNWSNGKFVGGIIGGISRIDSSFGPDSRIILLER